jgi:hypothetical protein
MDQFIHDQNLLLFRMRLADPRTTTAERKVLEQLLAEEEAKELPAPAGQYATLIPAGSSR